MNRLAKLIVLLLLLIGAVNLVSETIRNKEIRVKYAEKDKVFARKVTKNLLQDINTFQKKIGIYKQLPIKLIIAADNQEYRSFIKGSAAILEFSEAIYNHRNKTIYIRNPRQIKNYNKIRRILLHEYIHRFIDYFWKNPPLWFHEGMAVYFSNDFGLDRELNLIKNTLFGNSLTLEQMKSKYPENKIEWQSFYSQSALAVKYLYTRYEEDFYQLWDKALPSGNFEKVFIRSFLFTPEQFSEKFEEYSKNHSRWEMLLAFSSLVWGIMPLILLIGWLRKKLKGRKIEKQWQEEEQEDERI